MNVVAMIPVLLGSTRIKDKNLILVDGRILCSYTIEACRNSNAFSKIYLNSENDIFRKIAIREQVNFHKRPSNFGGSKCEQKTKSRDCAGKRCVTNEHYLYNFMTSYSNVDYVCQVNATSPLLTAITIKNFVDKLVQEDYDSLFAVKDDKAESFYLERPVNFSKKIKKPSQEIKPIQSVCWAIAGWRCTSYISSYERNDLGEDGPVFVGKQGVLPIDEREALDIDDWSTLDVVEQYLIAHRTKIRHEWQYYEGHTAISKNNS